MSIARSGELFASLEGITIGEQGVFFVDVLRHLFDIV
jgi:hypothetical protein